MDPKSTAKSKRIHSLHGRKTHPSPSAAAAAKKKPSSGSSSGGRHQKLPSNWTRYDNDDDVEEIGGNKSEETEVVVRSKGADYAYLIEEARKQESVVGSSLQEEFSFDFLQGSRFMLSTRGETLANWCEDDNFIVDDDNSSNYEVSSLSMDFKALAGQLSKMKIYQRLFLEDFLFSDELEKCYNTGYKAESNIPAHISTLSSTKPEIEIGSSDHISIEMVQSLTPKSEQENNNISNSVILDDALDDLLAETSVSLKVNDKAKDDNNYEKGSSKMDNNNKMDDILDDLLEQNLVDLKRGNEIEAEKRVDDFDSWFDSL
ncbi:hypothetical protein LUZ60_002740 [Juncus effusus]|nr:hypothetical protein LUZ60_002740 [Juncus effusus]